MSQTKPITNADVITFMNAATAYLKTNEKADHRLKYAVRKVLKACTKLYEDYSAAMEDLRIEHCAVDPKNSTIMRDDRGAFVFTKDALRAFNAASKRLLDQAVEVTPFLAKEAPADLTDDQRDAFAGFVLPEPTNSEVEQ